jgi:hypothetical protein
MSQAPDAPRHTNVLSSLFTKQVPEPLQVSGLSQSVLVALPHAEPEALKPSAGQACDEPLHVSAASQSPAAARHEVPEALGTQVKSWQVAHVSHGVAHVVPHTSFSSP